jgi:RNA polymerase sigma-70 factor (ECF subfamily)
LRSSGKLRKFLSKIPDATGNHFPVMADQVEIRHKSPAIDWPEALRQHSPWLRSVVAARCGEAGAIDEIMQEVALAAVRRPPDGLPVAKVAPWLYQVAVRQTLMYRRAAGRRRKLIDRFAQRDQPDESNSREVDPLTRLLAAEQATQIQSAMDSLHRRDKEILLLKYDQGWSYRELSDHLGISHSAVEARLHRARQRLRRMLEQRNVMHQQRAFDE